MSKSKIFLSLTAGLLFASAMPVMSQAVPSQDSVPQLVAVIKSNGAEKQRMDACRQLAIVGGKEAIAALAALLEDEKMSHMARYGLETIPDPAVNEALRAALPKVKGRLLAGVIGSLGVRKDENAMPLLVNYLNDTDPVVAQAAARAVGSIGNLVSMKVLKDTWAKAPATNRVAVAEGMLRCAESLIGRLRAKEAVEIYDELRQSKDAPHQVRTAALRGAILARKQDGLALLKESLASTDYSIVSTAARTSMEMTGSDVTKALAAELGKGEADRRILIARTLGGRHDAAALTSLMTAAQAGDKPVRLDALRAVGEIPHTDQLEALVKLMDDPDKEIAQTAQEMVASTQGKHADAIVLKLLADTNAEKRLTALDMLGRRRMTDAVPALLKASTDSYWKVRANAMKLLGDLGGANEIPALLDLMAGSKVATDLTAAEQGLRTLSEKTGNSEGTAAKLTAAMAKAVPAQKSALVRILGSVGGATALKAVRASVDDTDAEVRSNSIRVLGSWKTGDAAPELLTLAKASAKPEEKVLFIRGYLTLAANTDIPQIERFAMCQEGLKLAQNSEEKRLLLAALSEIHSPNSLALIRGLMDDKAIVEEASAAAVTVAEKLVEGPSPAKTIEPLEKVTQSSSNANLVQKAKKLLAAAKQKANK